MEINEILTQSEELRLGTIALAEEIELQRAANNLSEMDGMDENIARLKANEYTVLVCGELKRGKSSFINGLLGQEILPVGIEVATCQAFRIANKPVEAYRLRFDDGSSHEISRGELSKFGSQTVIDNNSGIVELGGKTLECIEVDYPASFLPNNVVLIDTPGMGALYAQHGEITERFVRDADAVVFVLDSDAPVKDTEIQFLRKISRRTRHIFFIQTRIDAFEDEKDDGDGRMVPAWQTVRNRNEEILKQKLKGCLSRPVCVWPISNKQALKASGVADAERMARLMLVSRMGELLCELRKFLFYVSGWARSSEFVLDMAKYWQSACQLLAGRSKTLMMEDRQAVESLKSSIECKQKELETAWKENGIRRSAADTRIKKMIKACTQEFNRLASPVGPLYSLIERKLGHVDSIKGCKAFLERLPEEVSEEYFSNLGAIAENLERVIAEQAEILLEDMDGHVPYERVTVTRTELEQYLREAIASNSPTLRPPPLTLDSEIRKKTASAIKWISSMFNPFMFMRKVADTVATIILPKEELVFAQKQRIAVEIKQALSHLQAASTTINSRAGQTETFFEQYLESHLDAWNSFVERIKRKKQAELTEEIERVKEHLAEQNMAGTKEKIEEAKCAQENWEGLRVKSNQLIQRIQSLQNADTQKLMAKA